MSRSRPRARLSLDFKGSKMLTEQHHKSKCCIHRIANDSMRGLPVDHLSKVHAAFSDFSTAPADFRDAMTRLASAQQTFDSLPAHIRRATGNTVEHFVSFVSDANNIPKLASLGLATVRPVPTPSPTPNPPVKE